MQLMGSSFKEAVHISKADGTVRSYETKIAQNDNIGKRNITVLLQDLIIKRI